MPEFESLSCKEFTELLASAAPVPGGGGACALAGALATALGNMVGSLTVGKAKYASVQDDIIELKAQADELQNELLALIDRDGEAFEPLSKAYRLPMDTEEARAYKAQVMEACLQEAAAVPLEIMERCCKVIDLLEAFAVKGAAIAISDVGVGAVFARAALEGASLNVFINTKAMLDRACAEKIDAEAEAMLSVYDEKAEKIYEDIARRFRS